MSSLTATAIGCGAASVVLSAWAAVHRMPARRVGEYLGPATELLVSSLVLVGIAVGSLFVLGICILCTRDVRPAVLSLGVAVCATSIGFLISKWPRNQLILTAGPGSHHVLEMARASWAVLVVGWAILIVASLIPRRSGPRTRGSVTAVCAITVVTAILAGMAGAWLMSATARAADDHDLAAPVESPSTPRAVGGRVGYQVSVADLNSLVPAGPGFVRIGGRGTIIGHDGATGRVRWTHELDDDRRTCHSDQVRSTGTSPGAVVVVACTLVLSREEARSVDGGAPSSSIEVLTGIDSMSGAVLWTNTQGWHLVSGAVTGSDVIPVMTGDSRLPRDGREKGDVEIASLDPRTGVVRWSRERTAKHASCVSEENVRSIDGYIVVLSNCAERPRLSVLDAATGQGRQFDVPVPTNYRPANGGGSIVMAHGDRVVVLTRSFDGELVDRASATMVEARSRRLSPLIVDRAGVHGERGSASPFGATVARLGTRESAHDQLIDLVSGRVIPITDGRSDHEYERGWASLGDSVISAGYVTYRSDVGDYRSVLRRVDANGHVTDSLSPCGGVYPGVLMPIPGAVLLACSRDDSLLPQGGPYEILALE